MLDLTTSISAAALTLGDLAKSVLLLVAVAINISLLVLGACALGLRYDDWKASR